MKTESLTRPHPEWVVAKAFAAAIIVGAALLCLPFSSRSGQWLNPVDALFMSTSATCVTGLTSVDLHETFSHAGQLILLVLVQVGGLGIMTFSTFFLMAIGRRMSIQEEFVVMDSLGHEGVRGLKGLLMVTIGFTAVIELIGGLILSHRFAFVYHYPLAKAVYYGFFHSIMAFCNAGFALFSTSFIRFQTDNIMVLTIAGLIILGGIGFPVLYNLVSIKVWRRNLLTRGRLTLHSRMAIGVTVVLILVGWAAILLLEQHRTLAGLNAWDRATCALFQSVTPRTAGFNVVDMAQVHPATFFITVLLMFIGGCPASTAGGVKATTLMVIILTVTSMIRNRDVTEFKKRTIPTRVVRESLVIFALGLFFVSAFYCILLLTQHVAPPSPGISTADALLFETVSAFGTVGLSTGITPMLGIGGKVCLVLCMFVGRLGPLTIALIMSTRDTTAMVRFPEEDVVVG